MYTAWGYEVENLPDLITVSDFESYTGGKYADDQDREVFAISAASAAIRNACGWHVTPSLQCTATLSADGRIIKLPARLVTSIESVTEDGTELSAGQYEARRDGLIRRACFKAWSSKWGAVSVRYTAGFEASACPDVVDAAVKVIEAVLSMPTGVTSEMAGNVSITYNTAQATGVAASAAALYATALTPYRLVSAHAS